MKFAGTAVLVGTVLVLGFLGTCVADLPVHCLHDQVKGTWVLHKGPSGNTKHVDCSKFDKSQATDKVKVVLKDPDTCSSGTGGSGFWTMIYDEGFEIVVDGVKYFAFSKYQPVTPNKQPIGYVTKHQESICDQTLAGWYHNTDGSNWGCYVAEQTEGKGHHAMEPINLNNDDEDEDDSSDDDDSSNDNGYGPTQPSFLEDSDESSDFSDSDDLDDFDENLLALIEESETEEDMGQDVIAVPDDMTDDYIVNALNGGDNKWTAVVYPSLLAEKIRSYPGRPVKDGAHARAVKDDRPDEVKYAGLPDHWDWRDVNGTNYDSPVRAQGDCGSCYAFSVASMMEARIRIATKNKKTPLLSPQDILSCCQYAQGCDGGYPYLVGKYLEDFGMVEESCFPYNIGDQCASRCQATPLQRWYGTNYHYVGGYYGNCNEVAMMKDILKNGPLTTALEAPSSLQYYSSGIFHHDHLEGIRNEKLKFEKTNHAVIIIGWGKDESSGEKYWIIKNTWGPEWGDKGYFKMRRGVDDSSIESMSVSVLPKL